MASAFTHWYAGGMAGLAMLPRALPRRGRWITLGMASAWLPDADVLGWNLGIPYRSLLGHRGLSHGIPFALAWAGLCVGLLTRGARGRPWRAHRKRLFVYLFLCTASHGLLDAMTDGGGGIAFLSPFLEDRWFLPWRPIRVSPLGIGRFFGERGLQVIQTELLWVWLPVAGLAAAVFLWRRRPAR
ncbi:MAG TPA: metal-dependent hydrolase [Planctomycetota bacterium]